MGTNSEQQTQSDAISPLDLSLKGLKSLRRSTAENHSRTGWRNTSDCIEQLYWLCAL